ncbi:MAG: M14 family zinc carboxypeptidase [Bryobacteraceae bacterium]|jgi:carboxypeptidase T
MARAFLYHVYDDPLFNSLAPLAAASIPVIPVGGGAKVPRQMYSLKRDLAQMRTVGAGKTCQGTPIVDASVTQVGQSSEGRDLLAIKVGVGSQKVVILGCHHAREWISVEMAYYIAEYLINNYTDTPSTPKEKRIKHLLMNRQIWFVPMVNPDGHTITINSNRDWRQNNASHAVPDGSVTRSSGVVSWKAGTYTGVDINRNYATRVAQTPGGSGSYMAWGTETFHNDGVTPATSRDPRDSKVSRQIWCGPSAASEPETQAIQSLVGGGGAASPSPAPTPLPAPSATPAPTPAPGGGGVRSTISFHNYGEQWLWPGPLTSGSDSPFVDWVGNGAVAAMGTAGIAYKFTGGPDPYLVSGDMIDFVFETAPGWRPAYTPEVRPANSDPSDWAFSGLPESQIQPCFQENLAATLAVINCAGFNAQSSSVSLTTSSASPAQPCQFVRNCWEVFKGWTP